MRCQRQLARAMGAFLLLAGLGGMHVASAQGAPVGTGQILLRKYANTLAVNQLLNESRVRRELLDLTDAQRPHLTRNIEVHGPVDVIAGHLAIAGNADRAEGSEEGIVCIAVYDLQVHAAIYSGGTIAVFSRVDGYDALPLCIKDWITQVNSGHRDRYMRPTNVEMVTVR
jgi:hypothetical protein